MSCEKRVYITAGQGVMWCGEADQSQLRRSGTMGEVWIIGQERNLAGSSESQEL